MSSQRTKIEVHEGWSSDPEKTNPVRIVLVSPNGDARTRIKGPAFRVTQVRIGDMHTVYLRGHFRPEAEWDRPLTPDNRERLMKLAAESIVAEEDPVDFGEAADNTRTLQALGHRRIDLLSAKLQ